MTEAFEILAGLDNYPWALESFYASHAVVAPSLSKPQDLTTLEPERVIDTLGSRPEVIIGGPPCQGFSAAGKRLESYIDDPRNKQVFRYHDYVKALRPKVFLMENVRGIKTTGQKRKNELLDYLIKIYQEIGYHVSWKVLMASDYRVPQKRPRFVMVGVREDIGEAFVFPRQISGASGDLFAAHEPIATTYDALSDLPSPRIKEPQEYEQDPLTPLQSFLRLGSDAIHNHLVTNHAPETVQKLAEQKIGTRLYDWNHSWYRLDPDRPSPTIKMNNRAPAVHYAEPRLISPRECARLQTIPDRIIIAGNKTHQLTQVGNAVPPIMAAHLASAIATQCCGVRPPVMWDADSNPVMIHLEAA